MVILVWAMTKKGIIGQDNRLPWAIKSEMQYFRSLTLHKTVVMGAKTFESIGKPLKNRYNIVVTRHKERYHQFLNDANIMFTDNLETLLQQYQGNKTVDIWIIGGKQIYQYAWAVADYLYVSVIIEDYDGDILFPQLDFSQFERIKVTKHEQFTAEVYQRKETEK